MVGTGDSEGSMNAANILKPALSRGEVQVIGATTFSEYRKYIEKDSALERRFQPVTVNEPTIADTIEVLSGIKKYYETFHKVRISDELIKTCAVLSERYIQDRFLTYHLFGHKDIFHLFRHYNSLNSRGYSFFANQSKLLHAQLLVILS